MTTTPSGKERFEILFDQDMMEGIRRAARMLRITPSTWIRTHCAIGLDDQGIEWNQDHPKGDQEKAS